MEDFNKLKKMQGKLKKYFTLEIIFLVIVIIAAIFVLLSVVGTLNINENIVWGAFIVAMLTLIIFTGWINFITECNIKYCKLYKSVFLTRAILYYQDAVMNCTNNSFSETERLNATGLVDFTREDTTILSKHHENIICYSGEYKDSYIEGSELYVYITSLEYRNRYALFKSEADRLETRMDRSHNRHLFFYNIGEVNNISYEGIHPVMIYHKDFSDKRLFKNEKYKIFPTMQTGDEIFDNMYRIKTIDPDKAKPLFTEDVIRALKIIGDKGNPMGLFFADGKVNYIIEEIKKNTKKDAFVELDYDNEYAKTSKSVDMYFNLLKTLKGERIQ